MKPSPVRTPIYLLLAACLASPGASFAAEPGWDWFGTTYLWAAGVTADFDEDARVSDSTTGFSDILDKTDLSFMGHIEGQGDDVGVQADLVYLALGDSKDFATASIDADVTTTIFDVAMVWSPGAVRYEGIELIAGLRYLSLDFEAEIDPVNPALPGRVSGIDRSFTDALVGARYVFPLTDQWSMGLRADSSFGNSEGTWSASLNFRREFGQRALVFGYRYFSVEVQPGDQSFELQFHGPQIAYGWRW